MEEHPRDRLETILSLEPEPGESPYSALDMLYRQILSTCRRWNRVYLVLQLLVTPHPELEGVKTNAQWHSSKILAGLLNFKRGIIEASLSRLHSVLHVPESQSDGTEIRIRHASFTEFLLEGSRSGEFRVKQHSIAEYCDLVTVFLLRKLSSFTSSYPPYRSTFDDAYLDWRDKTIPATDNTTRRMLPQFSIQYWSYYCCRVESPSADLMIKLNGFDPYVVGSLLPNLEHIPARSFYQWRTVLEWAKGLSHAPSLFIKVLEAFFRGFYIGYSKDTLRLDAIRWTFEVESGLISLRDWLDAEAMGDFTGAIYERICWVENLGGIFVVSYPILLPEHTPDPSRVFPEDWVVVRVAQSNGELMKRVYDARKAFHAARVVEDDIVYDTSQSVGQCVLEEEDLAAFKTHIRTPRSIHRSGGNSAKSKNKKKAGASS
ncbi:hypothetical protein VNI00_012004 [Paramarasmius palmivorus]|uniref:Uncharacterized protein n=1 Tax=Paramarasmius palmivorus TaxID=297713 RepID=A0AAW0CAM9_9AGAR